MSTAAAVQGKNVDLKVQRTFISGIYYKITGPKLCYARLDTDCMIDKLLEVAKQAEIHYQLRRINPTYILRQLLQNLM